MDYINIDVNEINDEKIIIPKKNYYCSNCNKKGHTYKNCLEPIISNGIIGIYIDGLNNERFEYLILRPKMGKTGVPVVKFWEALLFKKETKI